MDNVDLHVLRAAIDWLEQGHRVALATVVKTWGSAPRPPGSWLAMRADGQLAGSVSGGCVEDDLLSQLRDNRLATDTPGLIAYGVRKEEAARFGLTAALYGAITLKEGRVEQSNFNDYPLLHIHEMPQVEVHIVPSVANPTGVGEPGVPPIAPAVANALFAATGKRLRKLPFDTSELKIG